MNNYNEMKWTDRNIQRFWDYESNFKENYFTYQVGDKVINYFSKYFLKNTRLLDFGCGAGFLIQHLLTIDAEIYGLDFSDESLAKVNKKFSKNDNFRGAYTVSGYTEKEQKFDTIIATEVIEHLDDEKLDSTMNFILKSLAEQGTAIFTTPNDEDLSKSMIYCPEADCVFHRWQHVRSWSEDSLQKYLKKYFSHVEIQTTNFSIITSSKQKIKNRINQFLGRYVPPKQPHLIAIVKK